MIENKAKIFFTDLDGTLLNDQKEIPEENYECIQNWISRGNIVVISTGRALASAIKLAHKLKLTMEGCYIIAFNGGILYDTFRNQILAQAVIPKEYSDYLIRDAREFGIHIQSYEGDYFLCEKDNSEAAKYSGFVNMQYKVVDDLTSAMQTETSKLLVIDYESKEHLLEYEDRIREWAKGKVDHFFSSNSLLEIVPPNVSKGNAVKMLCEKLDIPLENTISAGDAENDIAMLQVTAKSIVMKNASEEMYQYATCITEEDNNHSGVAKALARFF